MRYLVSNHLFIVFLFFSFLMACTTKDNQTKTNSIIGHYVYQSNGDTIVLDLKQKSDSVFGDLKYAFSGKDKNIGKIAGVLQDSLIIADYNFMSEGILSLREVVFKLTDQGVIEGYGEIEENNGKVIFSDKGNLNFDHGMVLLKK